MVTRGKDSWNKGMIIQRKSPSSHELDMRNSQTVAPEANTRNKKPSVPEAKTKTKPNEETFKTTNAVFTPQRKAVQPAGPVTPKTLKQETAEKIHKGKMPLNPKPAKVEVKNMHPPKQVAPLTNEAQLERKQSATRTSKASKKGSNENLKPTRPTPLQSFDIDAFFEENLYDIIDLEENRSGIKEFEQAVKSDE